MQREGYDLRNKMGTLLRGKVDFTLLNESRDAYARAFSLDYTEIDEAITSLSLDAVSVLRNLIVHKSGKCDEEYQRRQQGIPALPQLEIGQTLELNGELIAWTLHDMVETAAKLIRAVDSWIATHPETET